MNIIETPICSRWIELKLKQSEIKELGFEPVTEGMADDIFDKIAEYIYDDFTNLLERALKEIK